MANTFVGTSNVQVPSPISGAKKVKMWVLPSLEVTSVKDPAVQVVSAVAGTLFEDTVKANTKPRIKIIDKKPEILFL